MYPTDIRHDDRVPFSFPARVRARSRFCALGFALQGLLKSLLYLFLTNLHPPHVAPHLLCAKDALGHECRFIYIPSALGVLTGATDWQRSGGRAGFH